MGERRAGKRWRGRGSEVALGKWRGKERQARHLTVAAVAAAVLAVAVVVAVVVAAAAVVVVCLDGPQRSSDVRTAQFLVGPVM